MTGVKMFVGAGLACWHLIDIDETRIIIVPTQNFFFNEVLLED